jgi:glucokinase
MSIIAPGTGLGEAGLYWDGSGYRPFPTEGGHCDFAPRLEIDIELLRYLQSLYGIVSWERLIAGPAIQDIFRFLCMKKKQQLPAWLTEDPSKDESALISNAAINKTDPVAIETMDLFVRYLAHESANLVLKMKSTGGLFLAGGIPPKIAPLICDPSFIKNYLDCDRMQHVLKDVPIRIVLNHKAPLLGSACYAAYCG